LSADVHSPDDVIAPQVTQLLAAGKMLAFLELPFAPMYTIVYPSLALEWIGITHCGQSKSGNPPCQESARGH